MSSENAISINNLSKAYRLGEGKSADLRQSIGRKFRSLFAPPQSKELFWALQDLSLDIPKGTVLGIIGSNGAGKSTLLKLLSRITEPTKGDFEIFGRVSSLLEVGTGFHNELTGRENIFLNGTILGMKRQEIKSKLDEIIDFSGVEKFLDTSVKHYSSGMKVRLAFAVAAHLEPEILIIDEVLAVGDADFQKKCLGKMDEVSQKEGRTILFVSHNMGAVKNLCSKVAWLSNGMIESYGSSAEIIDQYLFKAKTLSIRTFAHETSNVAYATEIALEDPGGKLTNSFEIFSDYRIRVKFVVNEVIKSFRLGIGFIGSDSTPIRTTFYRADEIRPGSYEVIFEEKDVFLSAGRYQLVVGLSAMAVTFQYLSDAIALVITDNQDKSKVVHANNGIIVNQMKATLIKGAP